MLHNGVNTEYRRRHLQSFACIAAVNASIAIAAAEQACMELKLTPDKNTKHQEQNYLKLRKKRF